MQDDLKTVIANNISYFRRESFLTQAELAEKLNYSDKAVSKWERGESIPDIFVLKKLADLFGVNVDYFLLDHSMQKARDLKMSIASKKRHFAILATTIFFIIFLSTLTFFILLSTMPDSHSQWKVFVCMLPIISIVCIVFYSIWWKKPLYTLLSIGALVISGMFTIFVFVKDIPGLPFNPWLLLILIAPLLLIVGIWEFYIRNKKPQTKQ